MNAFLRTILLPLPPMVRWYLSKKRVYRYQGLTIDVFPGVFHPGIFFSTKMILAFMGDQSIHNARVLEIGAGTGIISLYAARLGAKVTATDINTTAIENIKRNAILNNVSLTTIYSDLFDKIPVERFDWVLINPPYYPKNPRTEAEFAWYCGDGHEYFKKLFAGLSEYVSPASNVIMVLSDVCDLAHISRIAQSHQFRFVKVGQKRILVDGNNYLFSIKQIA